MSKETFQPNLTPKENAGPPNMCGACASASLQTDVVLCQQQSATKRAGIIQAIISLILCMTTYIRTETTSVKFREAVDGWVCNLREILNQVQELNVLEEVRAIHGGVLIALHEAVNKPEATDYLFEQMGYLIEVINTKMKKAGVYLSPEDFAFEYILSCLDEQLFRWVGCADFVFESIEQVEEFAKFCVKNSQGLYVDALVSDFLPRLIAPLLASGHPAFAKVAGSPSETTEEAPAIEQEDSTEEPSADEEDEVPTLSELPPSSISEKPSESITTPDETEPSQDSEQPDSSDPADESEEHSNESADEAEEPTTNQDEASVEVKGIVTDEGTEQPAVEAVVMDDDEQESQNADAPDSADLPAPGSTEEELSEPEPEPSVSSGEAVVETLAISFRLQDVAVELHEHILNTPGLLEHLEGRSENQLNKLLRNPERTKNYILSWKPSTEQEATEAAA